VVAGLSKYISFLFVIYYYVPIIINNFSIINTTLSISITYVPISNTNVSIIITYNPISKSAITISTIFRSILFMYLWVS